MRQKGDLEPQPANGKAPHACHVKLIPAEEKARKEEIQGVFVVPNGKAEFRKVETGITGATDIEVLSGLKEGDQIVTGTYQVIRTITNEAQVKVDNKAPVAEHEVLETRDHPMVSSGRKSTHRARRATEARRHRHPHVRSLEDLCHGRPGDSRRFRRRYRDQNAASTSPSWAPRAPANRP